MELVLFESSRIPLEVNWESPQPRTHSPAEHSSSCNLLLCFHLLASVCNGIPSFKPFFLPWWESRAPEGRAGWPGIKICRFEGKAASGSAQVPLQSALASALTVKTVTCVRVQTGLQEL